LKIFFVTTNRGKFSEIARMIKERGHEAENIVTSYPEIQADSLEAVVENGLQWLTERYESPILIDDSGLFVDALKGFPGVFSSYAFRTIGCDGILRLMNGVKDRAAHFECCLGFTRPGEKAKLFKGVAEGVISESMRGDKGFGFDPIFIPSEHNLTFAEMQVEMKNSLSHRGRAFERFFKYLNDMK